MAYEVVVVGGGIGGLTTAALLAAHGVNVCLLERQSRPGGCVANFEHLGYAFEPTASLYSGWEPGGVYEKIFSELPVKPPEVRRLSPAYVVRLPDQTDVLICEDFVQFEQNLRAAFPECADAGVYFYRELAQVSEAQSKTDPLNLMQEVTAQHLRSTSARFQRFIDVQLQAFAQCASDQCSYLRAAITLTTSRRGVYAIRGGAQALANALAESLKQSGGTLRLDSPVLRLAYGSTGSPIGVDLLNGERVVATRAIVSNLTIWDTYGKLIGLSRTPPAISKQLKQLRGWGAYLLFLAMEDAAGLRLKSDRVLVLSDWLYNETYAPDEVQFMFAAAPTWDARAPGGKRAVTISTFTNADEWFAFHENEESHEAQDQAALEFWWPRLHAAMPELGGDVEVIESATPRTFYETTRRKMGMVGGLCGNPSIVSSNEPYGTTIFPNLFLVGDTVSLGSGLEAVSNSALALANFLARR